MVKREDKYVYPAIFTYTDGCDIAVTFPDLPGCGCTGVDDSVALTTARDVLGKHLWRLEADGIVPSRPTSLPMVDLKVNEYVTLVEVYLPAVRLSQESRAVNRTVTLPAWLNAAALEKGINFSQALQSALMNELGINR